MSASDDENDDIFDQLKSIKPFTIEQLFSLHADVYHPISKPSIGSHDDVTSQNCNIQQGVTKDVLHDSELYQNLVEYDKLLQTLQEYRHQVESLRKQTFDLVDKIWIFKEEKPRKYGLCQQGKPAEASLTYKQAFVDAKQLRLFDHSFNDLADLIRKDYIYYSFESKLKRHKIATHLATSYQFQDDEARSIRLKSSISTLVDFIRHVGDAKADFVTHCRGWLRGLIKKFLENGSTEDKQFVIRQLCKSPAGTSDWSADLIDCKPFDQVRDRFESETQYLTHCSILLNELFEAIGEVIASRKYSRATDTEEGLVEAVKRGTNIDGAADQNWSLIDPRFTCSEDLNVSSACANILSETDVIKLCLRIPIAQIFRDYVKKCLGGCDLDKRTDCQFVMLKLLTLGTIIIKTYQKGLAKFNSIQYGNLIEYLSSQIRRTVVILSEQWGEFKRRLRGIDNALFMRLQVEYDNFILRSILIILELRESGIWRHLCKTEPEDEPQSETDLVSSWSTDSLRPAFAKFLQVTGLSSPYSPTEPAQSSSLSTSDSPAKSSRKPRLIPRSSSSLTYEFSVEWFREVSEPMLWHILWQFYHNAFVSSCDYHSDSYWMEKFREKSVIYLFVNKICDSPPGECSYLLNSVTNMVLSRTRSDSKLINFIAAEIFNLAFKEQSTRSKVVKRGTRLLARCAHRFPHLLSLYIELMATGNSASDDADIVELFKQCSLAGWVFDDDELSVLASWLVERPIDSAHSKVARLLITKTLLNSPNGTNSQSNSAPNSPSKSQSAVDQSRLSNHQSGYSVKRLNRTRSVDLKARRKLALLFYEATVRHAPEHNEFSGPQSQGVTIEVALGQLFCENTITMECNLLELATATSYKHLYIWCWRLLFTFRLHILDQPDTDWNDVQMRSGTSRSVRNTVLVDDAFHPVPTLQDPECLILSEGVSKRTPMALFIYLLMTDVTWQTDELEQCMTHLKDMAASGHLTPSLMAMKYLSICHLDNLSGKIVRGQKCLDYFTMILTGGFEATRLASLIMTQLQHLRSYRQLQLSQFYINVLLDVSGIIQRKQSASWFTSDEHNLDKIACLLDYLARFNFTAQRSEIIIKFYDCSYTMQCSSAADAQQSANWIGSLFSSNSPNVVKREFSTILHTLTQKFKKYFWLRWVTTECDALRLDKIWEDIVAYMSVNEEAALDAAIKRVCPQVNSVTLKTALPIYNWLNQIFDIVECDLSHPLCPILCYNFFVCFFANSLNGVSVGRRLLPGTTLTKLMSRLDALFNYHLYRQRNWSSGSALQQNSLAQLYRAYRLWLQDESLQDAYVDMEKLREEYLVSLLNAVMASSPSSACLEYVDLQCITTQNQNLSQIWHTATQLKGNHLVKDMIFVDSGPNDSMQILKSPDDDDVMDAFSLNGRGDQEDQQQQSHQQPQQHIDIGKLYRHAESDLSMCVQDAHSDKSAPELIQLIKKNFCIVFDESATYATNLNELNKTKAEVLVLIQKLYSNRRHTHFRVVACADGHSCTGPARIKFEVDEATLDDRTSECVQDRHRICKRLITDLLILPSSEIIQAAMTIESIVRQMSCTPEQVEYVIVTLLKWISETDVYKQLDGAYHASNHLLKMLLEILASSEEVDVFNKSLIDVCLQHPGSVQILSPHLSPSKCSSMCFYDLYATISSQSARLGPIAMFVLLSKFDVESWLGQASNEPSRENQRKIIATTCAALGSLGKHVDESFALTFDIFKRHLHRELALPERRTAPEIELLAQLFMQMMSEARLEPTLWTEFLAILGFEKQYKDSTQLKTPSAEIDDLSLSNLIADLSRFADAQTLLNYTGLTKLMQLFAQFVQEQHKMSKKSLPETYLDYISQFSVVMTAVSLMWLRVMSNEYPHGGNHELVWGQFMQLWQPWVLLDGPTCQKVSQSAYWTLVTEFVGVMRYMIARFPDDCNHILHSLLMALSEFVLKTDQLMHVELSILQRCVKSLPWNRYIAQPIDFERLAALSEQQNLNMSELVSHILLQISVKQSLDYICEQQSADVLSLTVERLATTLALQSNNLKGFRLNGLYFTLVPVQRIEHIAQLVLSRMEFANLEHSQNNKLLVNLMRYMCTQLDVAAESSHAQRASGVAQMSSEQNTERSVLYARFVSDYIVSLTRSHPSVVDSHREYLRACVENTLLDLKLLASSDVSFGAKFAVYEQILAPTNAELITEDAALLISQIIVDSDVYKRNSDMVLNLFKSATQVIRRPRVLALSVERLIEMYFDLLGPYESIWSSFELSSVSGEQYLTACTDENLSLALLIYFEHLLRADCDANQRVQVWRRLFRWLARLTSAHDNDEAQEELTGVHSQNSHLASTWLRVLDLFEPNIECFICADEHTATNAPETSVAVDDDARSTASSSAQSSDTSKQKSRSTVSRTNSRGPAQLSEAHECLVAFIKQLMSIYDAHSNAGIWSYLKATTMRSETCGSKIGLAALAISMFLINRTLSCLQSASTVARQTNNSSEAPQQQQQQATKQKQGVVERLVPLCDEVSRLRKSCLSKLDAARKSKSYLGQAQFIETLIESAQRHDKVHYSEGVQLISVFVKSAYAQCTSRSSVTTQSSCMKQILTSSNCW